MAEEPQPGERYSGRPQERPETDPSTTAGQSQQEPTARTGENPVSGESAPSSESTPKPEVPPASETWVEGQPTSDADYHETPAR